MKIKYSKRLPPIDIRKILLALIILQILGILVGIACLWGVYHG